MPDKKPRHDNDKKKKDSHVADQAKMGKTGSSDSNLRSNPLEKFERGTDNSIQRGQRIAENEKRQS